MPTNPNAPPDVPASVYQGPAQPAAASAYQGPATGTPASVYQGPATGAHQPAASPAAPAKRTRAKSVADGKLKPQKSQVASAKLLSTELHDLASSGEYVQIFGSTALPAEDFAAHLVAAAEATRTANDAKATARADAADAVIRWDTLLREDEPRFRAAWDLAVANDPSLPNRLPGAQQFLGARSQSASRAASTRKQRLTGAPVRPRTKA